MNEKSVYILYLTKETDQNKSTIHNKNEAGAVFNIIKSYKNENLNSDVNLCSLKITDQIENDKTIKGYTKYNGTQDLYTESFPIDPSRNNFIYQFCFSNGDQPLLPNELEFTYYFEYLKENQLKDVERHLICDSINQIEKSNSFDFRFFCKILRTCFIYPEIVPLMLSFELKKINPYLDSSVNIEAIINLLKKDNTRLTKSSSNNTEKVLTHFDYLVIYFNRHFNVNKFVDEIKRSNKAMFLFQIVLDNYQIFKGLKETELEELIELVTNCSQLINFIQLSSNYIVLNHIIKNKNKFITQLFNENTNEGIKQINIDELNLTDLNIPFLEIVESFSNLNSFIQKNDIKYIHFSYKVFETYKDCFGESNFKGLTYLKNNLNDMLQLEENKIFYQNLVSSIHQIISDKISKNDNLNYEIGKEIDLEKVDDKFIINFKQSHCEIKFERDFSSFLKLLFLSIKSTKTFLKLFILFEESVYQNNNILYEELINKFKELLNKEKAQGHENIDEIINLFQKYLENNDYRKVLLLTCTESESNIKDLFKTLIEIYKKKDCNEKEKTKKKIIQFLNDKSDTLIKDSILTDEELRDELYNSVIKQNYPEFNSLEEKSISKILEFCESFDEAKICLDFSKNLEQFLKTIIENYDKLKEFKKKKEEEEEEEYEEEECKYIRSIEPKEDDNLNEINRLFETIEKKDKDKIINLKKDECWEKYLQIFNNKNLNGLLKLKELKVILSSKKKKLYEYINYTGVNQIQNNFLSGNQIFKFLKDDEEYLQNYIPDKEIKNLIQLFKLDSADEQFLQQFKEFKFQDIFDSNRLTTFYLSLFEYCKDFKLFDIAIDTVKDAKGIKSIEDNIFEKLKTLLKSPIDKPEQYINLILEKLVTKVLNFKNSKEKILNLYIDSLPMDIVQKSFVYLYNSIKEKKGNYNPLKEYFINIFFVKLIQMKEINLFFEFAERIELIKNLKDMKKIFENLRNISFSENDFLSNPPNFNWQIFTECSKRKLNEIVKNTSDGYFYFMKEKSKEILEKLDKLNLSQGKILQYHELKDLEKRIVILSFGDENSAKKIYEKIKQLVALFVKCKEIIDNYKKFNNFYALGNKQNVNVEELESEFSNLKADSLYQFKNKLSNIEQFISKNKEYYTLMQSNFFRAIYEESKNSILKEKNINNNDIDIQIKEKAKKNFNKLKDIFNEDTFSNVDLSTIFKSFNQRENSLKKEIIFLKKYFNITEDTKKIENHLELLIRLPNVKLLLNGILTFIDGFEKEHSDYYEKIKKIISGFFNKEIDFDFDVIDIEKKLIDAEVTSIENSPAGIILKCLQKNKELFSNKNKDNDLLLFLKDKKENEIRNLIEFVDEVDDSFIKDTDVQELLKVVIFISQLTSSNIKKDKEFLDFFVKETEKAKNKNIEVNFLQVSINFASFKDLIMQTLNKVEFSMQLIKKLYKSSKFRITINNKKIKCLLFEPKNSEFEDIIEAKDRAMLKIKDKNQKKDSCQEIIKFAQILTKIEKLIKYYEQLLMKGEHNDIFLTIEIENGKASKSEQEKDIDSLIEDAKKNIENLIKCQKDKYEKNILMTFIHGMQFKFLYQFMRLSQSEEDPSKHSSSYDVSPFLYYIFRKNFSSDELKSLIEEEKSKDYSEFYDQIEKFLTKIGKKKEIKTKDLFSNSFIIKNNYQGLYSYLASEASLEREIISIYENLTEKLPDAHSFLFCTDVTTLEEIIAFIYRAMKCSENVLFGIAKVETLELEKRNTIINLLSYFSSQEEINSTFILFYTDKSSDIVEKFRRFKISKNLPESLGKKPIEKIEMDSIEIISSDAAGVGKSTLIEEEANKTNSKYVFFPLGGELTREIILNRLLEIQKKYLNEKVLFHLDLQKSDKAELLKNFLFCFLILKHYSQEEQIFNLKSNYKIKIEIPFGFIDFVENYPILKLFEIRTIKRANLPPLKVDNKIDSHLQIVCNYLQNIDLVSFKNLMYKPGINKLIRSKDIQMMGVLPQSNCEALIKTYFTGNTQPTYYQITSFVDVLGQQLLYFTDNPNLEVGLLRENLQEKKKLQINDNDIKVRRYIVESFIQITKHFIKGAYGDLIESQDVTYRSQTIGYDQAKAEESGIEQLSNKREVVSFSQVKPSLVFFNEDKMSLSIIATCDESTPEGREEKRKLTDLYNNQSLGEDMQLIDYKNLTHIEYLREVKKVLSIINKVTIEEAKKSGSDIAKSLEKIVGTYKFTSDNYIKMILILLRTRAKIPVILMGETGCGKTALIRMLSVLKGQKMKIFNIHAGITDEEIISFLEKYKLLIDNDGNKGVNLKKQRWVFLDEVNTCNSMGLISEMMCKRSAQGRKIKENVVFIAACNPYRKVKSSQQVIGLVREEHKVRNLVYAVHPLPHSLLNFVFDFGNLKLEDEKIYILSMIQEAINKFFTDKNSEKCKEIKEIAKTAVFESQDFIRKNNDVSSVSLREVRRFIIFFEWFNIFLEIIEKLPSVNGIPREHYDSDSRIKKAIILSVYLCYYLRISDKIIREKLAKLLNYIFNEDILIIAEYVQREIVDRVNLPEGIAKNRALKENLFALFSCVNNKVPIFICGKPGCSKSLSVQVLYNTMKGENSEDEMFRQFPRLFMNSYQGSITSTSKGVLKVFGKARNIVKNQGNESLISTVYFDEMGLAEISKNNPLKVIHSELEYDENKDKVAFIGISNWALDASKMNRGVYLSIPEPDKKDLEDTAIAIAQSYHLDLDKRYAELFNQLSDAYYKYKIYVKEKKSIFEDFHGSRDFYHLIKSTCRGIIKNEEETHKTITNDRELATIGSNSLERNFGGINFSLEEIKKYFKENNKSITSVKEYPVIECIKKSIKDKDSRYLLIISKSSISPFLIEDILNELNKENKLNIEYNFYIGSKFKEDTREEFYSAKVLNKIQMSMEEGKVLILRNLDYLYPNLYDLFNQNFREVAGKHYSRIALGSSNNSMSVVNDKFRCIVLVDENKLLEQEAPFLNRFEKHVVSFEYLLNEKNVELNDQSSGYNKVANDFIDTMKKIETPLKEDSSIRINIKYQMINCDKEEIQGLVYEQKKKNIEINKVNDIILPRLVQTFSQDIIAFTKISKLSSVLKNQILELYKSQVHSSLAKFIEETDNKLNAVYTFSNILDNPQFPNNTILTKHWGEIQKDKSIKFLLISSIRAERELEKEIDEFYMNEELKICIFKFKPENCKHINHVKLFLENYEKEHNIQKEEKKMYIFIVYIERILFKEIERKNSLNKKNNKKIYIEEIDEELNRKIITNKELLSHLTPLTHRFIDDLNGDDNINIVDIVNLKNRELYMKLFNKEQFFKDKLYEVFMTISYTFYNQSKDFNQNDHINKFIQNILEDKERQEEITNIILKHIDKEEDIIQQIFINSEINVIEEQEIQFITILKNYLAYFFYIYLQRFIVKSEKDGFLYSLYFSEFSKKQEIGEIWSKYLENIDLQKEGKNISTQLKSNEIYITLGMKVPSSSVAFQEVEKYIEGLKNNYWEAENNLRCNAEEDEENDVNEKLISEFDKYEKKEVENIITEIKKQPLFEKFIFNKNIYEQIKTQIFSDYYKHYLTKLKIKLSDFTHIEEIIKLMLNERFPDEKQDEYTLSKYMLWLESNSDTVISICILIESILEYIPDIVKKIKDNFSKVNENNERYPSPRKKVNLPFFKVVESFIKILLENSQKSFNKNSNDFLNKLKFTLSTCSILEAKLWLYQIKMNILDNYIQTYEELKKTGNEKEIEEYSKFFQLEKPDEIIRKQYEFLKSKIGNSENFPKLIISNLTIAYRQFSENDVRQIIFQNVLKSDDLILNSNVLIGQFFRSIINREMNEEKNEEDEDDKNFPSFISNRDDGILRELNQKLKDKPRILKPILFFFFENQINNYFLFNKFESNVNEEEEKEDNKNKYQRMLTGYPFTLFKKAINFVEKVDNNNKEMEDLFQELGMLFCLAYIKCYLIRYCQFNNYNCQEVGNLQVITDAIEGEGHSKLSKCIKIFILRQIKSFFPSFKRFLAYDFGKHQMNWFDEFKITKIKEIDIDYFFFDIELYDNFKKFYENFKKKNIEEENKDLDFYIILDIFLNLFFSKYDNKTNKEKNSSRVKELLEKYGKKIPNITKEFLTKGMNNENVKEEYFPIVLYSLKLAVQCSMANQKSFYYTLISTKNINNAFIPGGEQKEGTVNIENITIGDNNIEEENHPVINVRKLSQISYRLLNIIFYSGLYFRQLINEENNIKKYCYENKDCFGMIEINWNKLKQALNIRGIGKIEIFMHLIFPNLGEIIKNCTECASNNEREHFEMSFNDFIEKKIKEYKDFFYKYLEKNKELLEIEENSYRLIIEDLVDPTSLSNEYRYLEYFISPIYPTKTNFHEQPILLEGKMDKYPVITSYLERGSHIKSLKNLEKINPLANYMLNHYSFAINREEADKIKFKEIESMDDKIKEKFENFKEGYENVNQTIKIQEISPIKYFLNDSKDDHLSKIYQKFIEYQNEFLNPFCDTSKNKGIVGFMKEEISKKINVQDATKTEIISLEFNLDSSNFESFEELISLYSQREVFNKDKTVNYFFYNKINYDYDAIEKELGKSILQGKRLFSDKQKYVIYENETLRMVRPTINELFKKKYDQELLTEDEKKQLYKEIENKENLKKIMSSLQKLICYLGNENLDVNKLVNKIIEELPSHVKLDDSCIQVFKNMNELKLEKLFDVFEFVEYFLFDFIKKDLKDLETDKIDNKIQNTITEYFKDENNQKLKLNKITLASTIRKFILRFLREPRKNNNHYDSNLLNLLNQYKEELWNKKLIEDKQFGRELDQLQEKFNEVKCSEALSFYQSLGGDESLFKFEEQKQTKNPKQKTNQKKGKQTKKQRGY